MIPSTLRGCGRGILGLASWDAPRQPHPETLQQLGLGSAAPRHMSTQPQQQQLDPPRREQPSQPAISNKIPVPVGVKKVPMLAKYTYAANKETPLGNELSVTQGENLKFLKMHDENDNWWLAENTSGELGYVPASYMMKIEEKATSLPWLQNREPEQEESTANNAFGAPEKPTFKPYQSAYRHEDLAATQKKEFFCEVCNKQLNGPKPYSAHMASKAHKEEVELAAEFAQQS